VAAIAAAIALKAPQLRYPSGALAIWLFGSTWIFAIALAPTIWNQDARYHRNGRDRADAEQATRCVSMS
jgi:hypothetical protein